MRPSQEEALLAVTAIRGGTPADIAPCLLAWHDRRILALASRAAVERMGKGVLKLLTRTDGRASTELATPSPTRYHGVVSFELRGPWAVGDVVPLTRGVALLGAAGRGEASVIAVEPTRGGGFRRVPIPVDIETFDAASRGGSGDDVTYVRAHARGAVDPGLVHDGAPLLVHHAASRLLAQPEQWLLHGIACTAGASKLYVGPGRGVPFAELVAFPDDLGR